MFDKAIKKMLHRYEGDLMVINLTPNQCTCASSITAEPNPKCNYCFGTGKEAHVKNIMGVVQESNGPSTMRKVTDCVITKEMYIDSKYIVKPKDLLIFDNEVFEAYQIKTFRLKANTPVYFIVYATPLKYDSHFVIENLEKMGALKS